jgi:nucleoside-diphosphate-sugar epimerase
MNVTLVNRGLSSLRPPTQGAEVLVADVSNPASMDAALSGREFDVVLNMIAMEPADVYADIARFEGHTGQYFFISSTSAYQKPLSRLPITESTPLRNPHWKYARDKIACEDILRSAYRDRDFPATIVRPANTYDHWGIPMFGGWTVIDRMRRGKKVVVHGDGTSLRTLTHNTDFAKAFVGLFANSLAIGDTFQITSDFVYTWNDIYSIMARAAGTEAKICYATSTAIEAAAPETAGQHLGDRAHSDVFDNTKIRQLVPDYRAIVPFTRAAHEIIDWYDADASRRVVDLRFEALFDTLVVTAG